MIALLCSLALGQQWSTTHFPSMGTQIDVTLPTERVDQLPAIRRAFARVEDSANEWRPGTPLGRLNAAEGKPVDLGPDVAELLGTGLEIATYTDGAFDPTWAALWGLWNFRAPHPEVPGEAEVAERLVHVGHARVKLEGTVATLEPGARVGLGGIAKGWALDRAGDELDGAGVEAWTLSAGGQVLVHGERDGRPWRVGIRDPWGGPEDWFAVVELTGGSVSTSGDYERYFEVDGVRFHHILDPRTGRPATGIRSATVVGPSATWCDALSTAVLVLGADEGLAKIEGLPDYEALVVDQEGRVLKTPGMPATVTRAPAVRRSRSGR